jgi:hypothetical protein
MKLFIVHAGYYDNEIGIYELHTNFLIAAADVSDVKKLINEREIFRKKNMHIDAVQEIEVVDGYRVMLVADQAGATKLNNYDYTQMKQLA